MASSSTYSGSSGDSGEFTNQVNGFFEQMQKHWKLFAGVLGILIVAAAISVFFATKKDQKTGEGRNALFIAEKSLNTQLEAIAKTAAPAITAAEAAANAKAKKTPPAASAETVQFMKLNVDTQLADGVAKLKGVATEYADTRPGFDAMLVLGKLYLNHAEAAQAAEWFQKSTEHAPTQLDRAAALESLGYAYENQGNYKDALDAFDRSLAVGEATLKGDLLLGKARVFEAMNNATQAKATYDLIMGQLPNTESAKLAELFKARLK